MTNILDRALQVKLYEISVTSPKHEEQCALVAGDLDALAPLWSNAFPEEEDDPHGLGDVLASVEIILRCSGDTKMSLRLFGRPGTPSTRQAASRWVRA